MTREMKALLRELALQHDWPEAETRAVKRRVNSAINTAPAERRAYRRQKLKLALVLAVAFATLCGTAIATFRLPFLAPYFAGDTAPLEPHIAPVDGSITDGTHTLRLEGVMTDGVSSIIVGVSIQASTPEAAEALRQSTGYEPLGTLFAFSGDNDGHGTLYRVRRMPQSDTEDTIHLSVRLGGITGGLKLYFPALGPEKVYLDIPLGDPVESLELRPTPPAGDWDYAVTRVVLTQMGLQMEVQYPTSKRGGSTILPFYFRMADGSIETPSQFFRDSQFQQNGGDPWESGSRIAEGENGGCTFRYYAPAAAPLDLLSVAGIIVQGMEYAFLAPEQAVPIAVDEGLTPFLVPFVETADSALVPAQEVCQHLGAQLTVAPDGSTATITYRDTTLVLAPGSTHMTVNGRPAQCDVAPILADGRLLVSKDLWNQVQVGVSMYLDGTETNAAIPPDWWLIIP